MHDADQIADALIALINSSPRSPRKDEIVALINSHQVLAVAGVDLSHIMVVGCDKGATISVIEDARVQVTGWRFAHLPHKVPTGDEVILAVLNFLANSVRAKIRH